MNNSDIVTRKKESLKILPQFNQDFTYQDSTQHNQTTLILAVKPTPKLVITNFEFNKSYNERISIKNLMSFPLVLKLRSSDSKKLEVNNKVIKLSANQTLYIDLKIKIEKKFSDKEKVKENKINLHLLFTSELCDFKYFIELHLKNEDKNIILLKNDNFEEELNLSSSKYEEGSENGEKVRQLAKFQNFTNNLGNLDFIKKNSRNNDLKIEISEDLFFQGSMSIDSSPKFNQIRKSNFQIQGFSNIVKDNDINITLFSNRIDRAKEMLLLEENKMLKEKLEKLMAKFQEFEILIKSYAGMISHNQSETCEVSKRKDRRLMIDPIDNFSFFCENLLPFEIVNEIINNLNSNRNSSRHISSRLVFHPLNENDTPLEEKLGLNFNYTNRKSSTELPRHFSSHFHNHHSKTSQNFPSIISNRLNYTNLSPRFENIDMDYDSKINIEILGDNLASILLKQEKINIVKLNYEEIDNDLLNSIKERFIEIQLSNIKDNHSRVQCIIEMFDSIESILFENQEQIPSSSLLSENENRHNSYNSSILSVHNNYRGEKCISKFEKIAKKLIKILLPLKNLNTPISTIEKELIKKISTVSQEPLLSNEELEILFKEIQNISLISNELNNYKVENKKYSMEKILFTNEMNKIKSEVDGYKTHIKSLEEDLDLFRKELDQRDETTKTKDLLIEELQREVEYIKNNYIDPEYHERAAKEYEQRLDLLHERKCEEGDDISYEEKNGDLFKLLNEKDNQILEMKSKMMIQQNTISSLKHILDSRENRK